ncbi:putative DNA glycosylase [Helianthus debilis subsp. tardiflorus]
MIEFVLKMERQNVVNSGGRWYVEYKLPLGEAAATFNLEKSVCSHGFFMTAPNHWDTLSKTFQRPLHLFHSHQPPLTVQISQPPEADHLLLRVFHSGGEDLSPAHEQSLTEQVRRMLRLSDAEEKKVRAFQDVYGEAKSSGFGRVFRSPTLFEDMVKCILVCNCQWSRTLSMARALCELQLELQITNIAPKTPAGKESSKRKIKSRNLGKRCGEEDVKSTCEADGTLKVDESNSEKTELPFHSAMGNFPSPEELAGLNVDFLGKRCNLGYRASRILGLAQSVVEGRINLKKLEQDCGGEASLSNYMKINEQLGEINGFGPFTRANVLMCLGFYHVVPSDSETLRHLNQVHGKKSTIKNIQQDIEMIYGKYAPYQFLVYWSEIWSFYEERFGKLSELPNTHYKLITAANMRCKNDKAFKRLKKEQ